jgi:hypothetical protein
MNLASCVDDWLSTRTAGELLAGTKAVAPGAASKPATTQHRACTRMATDAHEDRCEAMPYFAMPLRRSGSAPPHRGPARGNPIPIPHRSTPGRACSGDCATFRKTLDAAERGIAQRQNFEEAPRS